MNIKLNCQYVIDGVLKTTDDFTNNDFKLALDESNNVITLELKVKKPVRFKKLELTIPCTFTDTCRIFTNGYQSWTISREYAPDSSMSEFKPEILGIKKSSFNPLGIWGSGDLTFHDYPTQSGIFYGFSYGYVRNGNNIKLFGSLSERSGYTILTFNTNNSTLQISKDLEGAEYKNDTTLLELAVIDGEYDTAFDTYFEMMGVAKPRHTKKCGYTTWYNYYTKVTADIVNRDLKAIASLGRKIDIFQIDDGYERTVGDWLIADSVKFPNGMKAVADDIHSHNMLAGLWLAPFAATPKSYIFKEHKDWFVTDEKGKIHYASHNWGGFYALDIYNNEAREYIKKVFDTVLNEWGYDMVKLDFLYACCIRPIHNKTRGEIMCDAMDLLRECCGDKIILGCGVPLAAAFGKVDFCRIGCDVALDWAKKPYSREDVSTVSTLTSTVFRRHLNGRAWLNDPDVVLLRDNNIKMSLEQRRIVATVNSLLGSLLFVSDDVSTYTSEQLEIFVDSISRENVEVTSAEYVNDEEIKICYTENGETKEYQFNIKYGK